MSFYRRDVHVIEVQIGSHTKRQEDACSTQFFNRTNLPYVTLVSKFSNDLSIYLSLFSNISTRLCS